MLQVVFDDSEKGCLCHALRVGTNNEVSTFDTADDALTPEEAERMLEGMRGTPVAGEREDVLSIGALLDVGGISKRLVGGTRKAVVAQWLSANPWDELGPMNEEIDRFFKRVVADHNTLLERAQQGEPVRIWYSDAPYALCGFYSVLHMLQEYPINVSAIRLPAWEATEEGIVEHYSWGEIGPGKWSAYLPLERTFTLSERRALATRWEALRQENAPLRAVVNGHLHSVEEDFYDGFVRSELPDRPRKVAALIGTVLLKHQLGISDWWIAQRIRHLLSAGELTMVDERSAFYDCTVKKAMG